MYRVGYGIRRCTGLLVEIEPEGGCRHNSPLNRTPFSKGVTVEGPLGDEGNAQ
jgi:hypothetical protein